MRSALLCCALGAAACGSSDRVVPLQVSGCDDGPLRFVALLGADRCADADPRGDGPAEGARFVRWDDPADEPAPRIVFEADEVVTVAAECRDSRDVVVRWGCDDDADGVLRVDVEDLCVDDACPGCGPCPSLSLARRIGGGEACVTTCDRCSGIECPPQSTCEDGTCVPTEECSGVECDEDELCVDGACVPLGQDADGDGFAVELDCDDGDPLVFPGSTSDCVTACGEGKSSCAEDATWGPCVVQDPDGECVPGANRDEPCGQCGTRHDVCSDSCSWQTGACMEEGECEPDAVEPCPDECGTRTCGADCRWAACVPACQCERADNGGTITACVGETACLPASGCGGPNELMRCEQIGIRCGFISRVECGCELE